MLNTISSNLQGDKKAVFKDRFRPSNTAFLCYFTSSSLHLFNDYPFSRHTVCSLNFHDEHAFLIDGNFFQSHAVFIGTTKNRFTGKVDYRKGVAPGVGHGNKEPAV